MMNLALRSIFVYFETFCGKNLRYGADDFTSPPQEGVLRIFIALKNPSPAAGIEPTKTGSDGKHANHYSTEDDLIKLTTYPDHLLHDFLKSGVQFAT
jgi:hypothetical protein